MKDIKTDFRHESLQDNKTILKLLRTICDGIEKNKVTFTDDDDTVTLHPDGLMNLKITASQNGNDNRLNVRIKWQTKPDKKLVNSSIKIS